MDSSLSDSSSSKIAVIRVDLNLNQEFDYSIPESLTEQVTPGTRVRIPFGNRKILGTVIHLKPMEGEIGRLKAVLEIVGESSLIPSPLMKLAEWMSSYYMTSLEQTLRSIAPSIVQKRASIRKVRQKEDPELIGEDLVMVPTSPLPLSPQQSAALDRILEESQKKQPKPVLLFGVTGSGKTEVYLQAIDQILKEGKSAIMLVPEIALTPQTLERLRARFCSDGNSGGTPANILAVLHSGLSQGERFREWQRIRQGEARLVVGARSAVFAPVNQLGIIVVDEEHENTYKQEESPRYHGRDVAVMRGHFEGAVVILGSATPALESFHNAETGKYVICHMPERVDSRKLPDIRIVDMRQEMLRQKGFSIFSESLRSAIQLRLERGEQVILYLNRRGYASSLICKKCGYVAKCPECSVSLSYHRKEQKLKCHFCGLTQIAPMVCPSEECRDPSIRYSGVGTEKLEEFVTKIFPQARVARMDSDTMRHRNDYEKTLLRFKMGKLDILMGTQMIAKGLDFPRVTLVGIVYADVGLHVPDFRSGERTFQQITQVAGRAGRGDVEGEVIVQTFTPKHYAIRYGKFQDFSGFYKEEMLFRKTLDYPPFNYLTKLEFSSVQASKAEFVAKQVSKLLKERIGSSLNILGPAPAPIEKLRGKFRFQIFLRDSRRKLQKTELLAILNSLPKKSDVKVTADVDPFQML